MARALPTMRGSRCVPPSHGSTPAGTWGMANRAPSAAMRRSQARASSSPWPMAGPLIAAMTGASSAATVAATRGGCIASPAPFELRGSGRCGAEQKCSPVPATTMTRTPMSWPSASQFSRSAAAISASGALPCAGRSSVIQVTWSCVCKTMPRPTSTGLVCWREWAERKLSRGPCSHLARDPVNRAHTSMPCGHTTARRPLYTPRLQAYNRRC